jgi:hypothetical protein
MPQRRIADSGRQGTGISAISFAEHKAVPARELWYLPGGMCACSKRERGLGWPRFLPVCQAVEVFGQVLGWGHGN